MAEALAEVLSSAEVLKVAEVLSCGNITLVQRWSRMTQRCQTLLLHLGKALPDKSPML